ncbi:MAG: OsmC family protein [Niastella sp.]|nr:OsmC family protein [Niastella sp.]
MTATVEYAGNLRCISTHLQSGSIIETDAPTDNRGKGERFSPTDSVCMALATCMITTMGIKAMDMKIELRGTKLEVTKHMLADPRRIGKIEIVVHIPALNLDARDKDILERTGNNCPVMKSLHPDLIVDVNYEWA